MRIFKQTNREESQGRAGCAQNALFEKNLNNFVIYINGRTLQRWKAFNKKNPLFADPFLVKT